MFRCHTVALIKFAVILDLQLKVNHGYYSRLSTIFSSTKSLGHGSVRNRQRADDNDLIM